MFVNSAVNTAISATTLRVHKKENVYPDLPKTSGVGSFSCDPAKVIVERISNASGELVVFADGRRVNLGGA